MSVGKTVGILADKMLKLTGKAVKKLEDYGAKSAEENNNDNARKLAETMNKLGKKLEERHDEYIARVEENADELAEKGKDALDKLKKVYQEMKTRADAAKEKAEIDARRDVAPESAETEDKAAEKRRKRLKRTNSPAAQTAGSGNRRQRQNRPAAHIAGSANSRQRKKPADCCSRQPAGQYFGHKKLPRKREVFCFETNSVFSCCILFSHTVIELVYGLRVKNGTHPHLANRQQQPRYGQCQNIRQPD